MENETNKTPYVDKGCLNGSTDFWIDAQEFLKPVLPEDFSEKLIEFGREKGYNRNEFRFFLNNVEEFVHFQGTMAILKSEFI